MNKKNCTNKDCLMDNPQVLSNFNIRENGKLRGFCKNCEKLYSKKYYYINREKILKKAKEYRDNNKDLVRERNRNYYSKHKESISNIRKENYKNNKDLYSKKSKEYYRKNREDIIKNVSKYYLNNKEYISKYKYQYFLKNKDKIYNRKKINSSRNVNIRISDNIRKRLNTAIKGNQKVGSTVKDLGCSIEYLVIYLEERFYNHPITGQPMAWNNYGFRGWHIDHIVPLSNFNLSDREQFLRACHYTNLQPLWAEENLSKNNKLIENRRKKMTNIERTTRVRYSRLSLEDRTPKNTLVTVRDGEKVFFGIARCNRKMDTFHKKVGSYIAEQRALLAKEEVDCNDDYKVMSTTDSAQFSLHKSGLRGEVHFENVRDVVKYFYTVDEYCLSRVPRTVTVGVEDDTI